MKIRWLALLIVVLTSVTTGCAFPEQYPIEEVQNILVIGVDIEDGQVKLTAVVDKITPGSKTGEEQIGTEIYTATGATVFDAKRELRVYSEKRTSWYHLKYILIGEATAKQDIGNALDFFCENDENRFLHRLLVSKGSSAADFLTAAVTQHGGFADYLDSLFNGTKQTGQSSEVRLLDYAGACECPWSSIFIPTVSLVPSTPVNNTSGENAQSANSDYLVQLSGYAIFNEDQLAGYLDARQAMGLNIVINEFNNAQITVTDMHGQPVSLEVVSCKTKIKPTLSGGTPSALISVVFDTFMVEYHETSGATKDDYISYLEAQQNRNVMDMISSAIDEARRHGTDIFGIGRAIYHAYPAESEKLKQNWAEIFSAMDISVKVTSAIQCTYSMLNAPGK